MAKTTARKSAEGREPVRASDERRVASLGVRERSFRTGYGKMLPHPDKTLQKFGCGDVALYTRVLRQFPNVSGYCQGWVDHVLVEEPAIKPAKASNPEDQDAADAGAIRAQRAWMRARNRFIVMQRLLFGRFYGFARAEMVPRYDESIGEWIHDLYDVPQESWRFDDDGRDYLLVGNQWIEVDPLRFAHLQWGSADTKYGEGALSSVYVALWKLQKLEEMALRRIEDNESVAIIHVPQHIVGTDRTTLEASYAAEFSCIFVPSTEQQTRTELPTQNITTSGAAGRQEYEGVRFYERWIQTHLLGAPQTGDKSLGTGKLEETRAGVWDDKTPIGRAALAQCLTESWMRAYCDLNLSDLPMELRPRFESDATDIASGLTAGQALEARNITLDLVAKRMPAPVAVEHWGSLGMPRARALAMADSILKERDGLMVAEATTGGSAAVTPSEPTGEEEPADADQ